MQVRLDPKSTYRSAITGLRANIHLVRSNTGIAASNLDPAMNVCPRISVLSQATGLISHSRNPTKCQSVHIFIIKSQSVLDIMPNP
jgi:hypothetical protein